MAFKLKGMGFGKGTGYKSPQMMKKESAMKMAGPSKEMKRTIKKKLSEKSRYTDRTPQSQMSDMERAAIKGISKPQSVKPTPPSRRYKKTISDSPKKMAKKSAMKKKEEKNKKSTKKLTWSEAVAYDKEMGATGENALTYGMEEGSKPGTFRVKDGFEKNDAGKVVKSPKTMKKGSAMDMKKKSAMTMKKKSAMAMKKKK